MSDQNSKKWPYIAATAIKFGLWPWLIFAVVGGLYVLLFEPVWLTWRRVAFVFYSMIFWVGVGALQGWLMWRERERKG